MVGDLLTEAGVPTAVMDLDWRGGPGLASIGSAWGWLRGIYARAPAATGIPAPVRIVLAGVIETRVDRDRHEDVPGVPLSVAGFAWTCSWYGRVSPNGMREKVWRLSGPWPRSWELDNILEAAAIEDFTFGAKSSVAVRWPTG
jgi:adenylylsulfate kinase